MGTLVPASSQADATWTYAVQITATVQSSPPAITLQWQPDQYGANNYNVYRKNKEAGSWNHLAGLSGTTLSYTDYNVGVGAGYEYQVVKAGTLGTTAYGYIYAGIQAPFTEHRGKVLLIVDSSVAAPLANELARLKNDLIGDGWAVARREVGRGDSPSSVRNTIISEYNADPGGVRAVFLFGHVPILRSGNLNVDGHQSRPMPADTFYGDVDGWWDNPSYLPSDVELMVGRVDLWNMPGAGAPSPWPSEVEMLRNYLNKDHAWRHKKFTVPRRAVLGNRFGDFNGEAFAASGFRNFDPLVGAGRTDLANEQNEAAGWQRWTSMLGANSYLWAYGCGAGSYTSMSFMGTHGAYAEAWSTDIVALDAKAVFFMMFGSWLGEWDTTDNIMRAALATPSMGLTCSWSGRPHWYYHHMAMGEPIGYSTRLSMNNNGLYRNQVNGEARGVHMALMGDPTLRMHQVAPPSNVGVSNGRVTWSPSPDQVAGYHVYRANTANGPFDRITSSAVGGTAFTDSASGSYSYMVRALQLENTPSGSYYNLSQGAFASGSTQPDPDDDTTPPSASLNTPGAGAILSGADVWLRAAASDNVRVAGVQFRIDGVNAGTEIWVAPYELRWDTTKSPNGAHQITAIARDNAGNRAVAGPITVTVNNSGTQPPDEDTTQPSISLNAPGAGATLSGSGVWLRAAASDNVRVAGVQFRINGVNAGTEIWVPPYELQWDTTKSPNGPHQITAVARDNAGNRTVASPITVTVSNGGGGGSGPRVERAWVDDSLPFGAQGFAHGGDAWKWITGQKYSGAFAHRSKLANGLHEHWFDDAQAKLNVKVGDVLFTYVYIDPASPPRQIMLQWSDGSWEHRAYWGQSLLGFGTEGTEGRRYIGPLPKAGRWVRLEVPASLVGLEGKALQGMAFTLWDGRVTWDRSGKLVRK